jgi:hypothetical protein
VRDETERGRGGRSGGGEVFEERGEDWAGDSLGFRRDEDGARARARGSGEVGGMGIDPGVFD